MIPRRLLIGLTFCPILLFFYIIVSVILDSSRLGIDEESDVVRTFTNSVTAALRCRAHALHCYASIDEDLCDV